MNKTVVVIDGQGGRMGSLIVESLKKKKCDCEIVAVGTNSAATAAMMKSGADAGATGENPVIVNCGDADIIVGPIGILVADALHGEITPRMAAAVGRSHAEKILIPINRCNNHVVGIENLTMTQFVECAVKEVIRVLA